MTTETDQIVEQIDSEEEDLDVGMPIYQIRSYPSDPELETLHARWKRGQIVIPDYQRGYIWKPAQASRLIESFLMGLPVPGIFMLVRGDRHEVQEVIDGHQRLRSVFSFFEGNLPSGRVFRLTGVDDRWEGKRYADLASSEQITLLTSVLRVVNVELRGSKRDDLSVYQIFERLNTGGMPLNPQEIRNSSYSGSFNDMLKDVNKEPMWRKIFGTPQPDARMRDVELIVRFLALYEGATSYSKPMKKFINDYMAIHQEESDLEKYRRIFRESAQQVVDFLGERPFHIRRGINVAVFDSVMVAFAQSRSIPKDIGDRYECLKNDQAFIDSTTASTTDVNTVHGRLALAQKVLFR